MSRPLCLPKRLCQLAALCALLAAPAVAPAAAGPARVVSLNLCTDQLAMLIAAPGQLVSVGPLAADPAVSLMPDEAAKYPANHARAEEIYLLAPDLVLAGSYGARATVDMLRRLGLRVETRPPAASVADVREAISWMGEMLDQPARAAAVLAEFDAALAALPGPGPGRAVSFGANGWTAGRDTLAGDVLRRAGWQLPADAMGLTGGGEMPVELLVMADPDLLVSATRYDPPSRAEDILAHPALALLGAARVTVPDRDWICGLPHVATVAAGLAP